jgi:hypothetical protein
MKKLLIAVAALMGFSSAYAGDYHHGEELKCQQCHTMHASRQHNFEITITDGSVSVATNQPQVYNGGAGFDKLLVGGSTNATCLSCHNRGGYDVWGQTTNASFIGKRSAGALNPAPGATDLTSFSAGKTPGVAAMGGAMDYAPQMGHSMGFKGVAPGGLYNSTAATFGFDCGDCHEVHGNAAYRNLGPQYSGLLAFDADSQPTYAIAATVDPTVDVTEDVAAQYDGSKVSFGFGGGANRMNAYCAKCHGNFHSDGNTQNATNSAFVRHPTGNAATAYDFAMTDGRYTARDAVRPVYTSATNVSPGCLTCHKAHGNARAYGLIHPAEAGANVDLENGDEAGVIDHTGTRAFYNPKTLCTTCHYQGKH